MATTKRRKKEPQFAYRCIFCGNTGATKEHVISDWISRRFPHAGKTSTRTRFSFSSTGNPDEVVITPDLKFINKPLGSKQAKIVCRSCNNGWMKKVVDQSRPIIIDLIEGTELIFTSDMASRLSAWVMLTNIVFEYDQPETKTITRDDRIFLRDHGFPPSNWEIWVSKTDDEGYMRRLRHVPFGPTPHPSMFEPLNSYSGVPILQHSLIGIEKFIFLSRSLYLDNVSFNDAPILQNKFIQIWPLSGINEQFQKTVSASGEELEWVLHHMSDKYQIVAP